MHHTLDIASAWQHEASVEARGFVPEEDSSTPAECRGRSALTFSAAAFSLHLRPTPAQLRALAALANALAEEQEAANAARVQPTAQVPA